MKDRWLLAANLGLFVLAGLANATIQTVLWYQFFGAIAAPALWLLPVVYFSVYRSTFDGVLLCYLIIFFLCPMTIMPFGLLLLVTLAVFISCQMIKSRVYWETSSYTALIAGISVILFNLVHFVFSWIFESALSFRPDLVAWILQPAMTAVLAPMFFRLFAGFDKWTHREALVETEIQSA